MHRSRVSPVAWCLAISWLASGCSQDDTANPPVPAVPRDASAETDEPDARADASPDDAAPTDAGQDVLSDSAPDAAAVQGPALYPSDRTQSPMTPWVADRLADILARNPSSKRDVFMKVGDSITASGSFLNCFAGNNVNLDAHGALQPAIDLYGDATVAGTSPFNRTSLSVESGKTAWWAMSGQPPPVQQELAATQASVAVVMFGTNDIGWFGDDHLATLQWYHDNMFGLVDKLADAGIIPILSTIPPRDDTASLDAWVPTFNAVLRGMAQGRQVPLVDFHRELVPLPSHGLASDGVHPSSYSAGACVLTPEGLTRGYNVRNLLTLEALDRVRQAALAAGGNAPDSEAPMLQGEGTEASPFVVQGNPFTDLRDTTQSASRHWNSYGGCSAPADESGPEYVYRFDVTDTVRVRAIVLDRGDVDIDLHLLDSTATEAGCMTRGDALIQADLGPGTYHFVLDTYVNGGVERGGEYLFAILTCSPGDPACE